MGDKNSLVRLSALMVLLSVSATIITINSCKKSEKGAASAVAAPLQEVNIPVNTGKNDIMSEIVKVAAVRKYADGSTTEVAFARLAELIIVPNVTMIPILDAALKSDVPLKITYDPWKRFLLSVSPLSNAELLNYHPAVSMQGGHEPLRFQANRPISESIDNAESLGIINTTTGALTPVVPDFATAQLMFNYITKQCCTLPGPYAVDYCITFQYCPDGCYARAHKMCYIINNRYNYSTHKVFSFANMGSDALSVKAEKWGGCCINWWYHVAPLVTVQTPTGQKAFVFDPAMFDQPVLLSTWLHAQTNPACSSHGHVSMINIQPTTSYSPSTYSGYTFDTDPSYSSTDTTLVNYRNLISCP